MYICVSDSYFFLSGLIVPQIVRQFIYFLNERFRHMPQIVPTFYLFLQRTLQTPSSNCGYILFISSMNAPDTCLKLCLQIIYFLNERSRDLPQIVCHFIYFLNERPIHMPQIVPTVLPHKYSRK